MKSFIISNKNGVSIKILSYAGIIKEINTPDKLGKIENIVLNYKNTVDYLNDNFYLGSLIGRYANRIKKSSFNLNGIKYDLESNEGLNHLHGGNKGFHKKEWIAENHSENSLTLSYLNKHLECGYPGNLKVTVKYSISKSNIFDIEFYATSDRDTIFNPTSHSYYNLNPNKKTIINHRLKINADKFLTINKSFIPNGDFKNVNSTPFDFRKEKK